MKNFIERAITEVQIAETKRAENTSNMRVFVIMTAYILGNEKAYISSNLKGAPIYEVTYDTNRRSIYFVTYQQTNKEIIVLGGK